MRVHWALTVAVLDVNGGLSLQQQGYELQAAPQGGVVESREPGVVGHKVGGVRERPPAPKSWSSTADPSWGLSGMSYLPLHPRPPTLPALPREHRAAGLQHERAQCLR